MKTYRVAISAVWVAAIIFLLGTVMTTRGEEFPPTQFGYGNGADGVLTVFPSRTFDLSKEPSNARRQPDGISFIVSGLSPNTATLQTAPFSDALKIGDEVILINVLGKYRQWKNVGNYEFLRIKELAGNKITFQTNIVKDYGSRRQTDGVGDSQVVILQRVPNYDKVEGGGTITSTSYGLVVFRVQNTLNDVKINVDGKGLAPNWGIGGEQTTNAGVNADPISSIRKLGFQNDSTRAMALADMDNDGDPDLIVGNNATSYGELTSVGDAGGTRTDPYYVGGQSLIYLNNLHQQSYRGQGKFTAGVKLLGTAREKVTSIAVGDVDKNGGLDIVFGCEEQQSLIYYTDGKGNVLNRKFFGTGSEHTQAVALGDMNKDGFLDIVVGNDGEQNLIYLNDGHGNFSKDQVVPFGPGNDRTTFLVLLDWEKAGDTGDGDLDIAVGNWEEQNVLYINENSNFNRSLPFGPGNNKTTCLAVGDVDGNRRPDIAVGNYEGQNCIYLQENNNFGATINFGTGKDSTRALMLYDINQDGTQNKPKLDIIVGNDKGQRSVVYLNQDGDYPDNNTFPFSNAINQTTCLSVNDIDDDLIPEIIVGNYNQRNSVFKREQYRMGEDLNHFGTGSNLINAMALGDVNGDKNLDIVVGCENGQNVVYYNNGLDYWGSFQSLGTNVNDTEKTNAVAMAYINNDEWLDIAVGKIVETVENDVTRHNVTIYLNDGKGNFDFQLKNDILDIGTGIGKTYALAFADVDNDGDKDLAVGNYEEQCILYFNSVEKYLNGSVASPFPENRYFGSPTDKIRSLAFGDVNGDGFPDLAAANAGGQNWVYINKPEYDSSGSIKRDGGNFLLDKRPFGSGNDYTFNLALGDIDLDGDLDIVAGNYEEKSYVYLNDGKGNFNKSIPFGTAGNKIRSLALMDMNQDEYMDIIAGIEGGQSQIFINYYGYFGTLQFDLESINFGSGGDTIHSLIVNDLDNDNDVDIVMGNYGQDSYTTLNSDSKFNSNALKTNTAVGGGGGANGADGSNGKWNFNNRELISGGKNVVDLYTDIPRGEGILLYKLIRGGGGGSGIVNNKVQQSGGSGGGIVCVFARTIIGKNIIISAMGGQPTNRYCGGGAGGSVLIVSSDQFYIPSDLRVGGGKFQSNDLVWGGEGGNGIYYFYGYNPDEITPTPFTPKPEPSITPTYTPTNTPSPGIPPIITPTKTPTKTPPITPPITPTKLGPFEFPLNLKIGPSNFQLSFGNNIGATDKYDLGIDVLSPPPDPSGREAYFLIDDVLDTSKLWKDIRNVNTENLQWKLIITVPPNQDAVIQWKSASFPIPEGARLNAYLIQMDAQDIPTGKSVDMKKESLINIPSQGGFVSRKFYYQINFKIVIETTIYYDLIKGWNLLSVPLNVGSNTTPQNVFGPMTPIWIYNTQQSQYEIPGKFETHKGYWIFAENNGRYEIKGYPENNLPITLIPTWNLIGVNEPVLRSTEGVGVVWGFDNAAKKYIPIAPTEYLEQQKGYWFQVSAPVTLFETPLGKVIQRGPASKTKSVQKPFRIYILNPSIGQAPLASLEIGRDQEAVDGIGLEDYLAPPPVPGSEGNAFFWTNNGIDFVNTVRDIRSMNGEQEWILEIDQKTNVSATITWDSNSFKDLTKAELVELDPTTQMPKNGENPVIMNKQNTMQLQAPIDLTGSTRYFKIILSEDDTGIMNWLGM